MTVKEMRSLLEYLPDDTVIELFNDAAEWYGIEVIDSGAWQTVNGKLVLMFGNYKWDKHALESYYRENKAMSNYYEARYNRHNERWRGVVYTYGRDDNEIVLFRSEEVETKEEAIDLASDWMTDNDVVAEMM